MSSYVIAQPNSGRETAGLVFDDAEHAADKARWVSHPIGFR